MKSILNKEMNEFYDLLYDQISHILDLFTDYSNLGDGIDYNIEVDGSVTQDTCALNLFVTFLSEDGRRLHYSEMITEGLISQKDFDEFSEAIAEAARKTPAFERDGILIFPAEE